MESGFEESTTIGASSSNNNTSNNNNDKKSMFEEESRSNNNNNNNEAGDFECNICFELAQDPIVTLCGHLFCWPCLYRWLRCHSQSQECPVCKALIQEDRLVPLYGKGKLTSDPRSRPVPGVDIPNRPPGKRPETAQPPHRVRAEQNYFSNLVLGLLDEFMSMTTDRLGNMVLTGRFGGYFPSLFSLQHHMYPYHGFPYGYAQTVHGNELHHGHGHGFAQGSESQQQHRDGGGQGHDSLLKNLFLIGCVFVLVALFWW